MRDWKPVSQSIHALYFWVFSKRFDGYINSSLGSNFNSAVNPAATWHQSTLTFNSDTLKGDEGHLGREPSDFDGDACRIDGLFDEEIPKGQECQVPSLNKKDLWHWEPLMGKAQKLNKLKTSTKNQQPAPLPYTSPATPIWFTMNVERDPPVKVSGVIVLKRSMASVKFSALKNSAT